MYARGPVDILHVSMQAARVPARGYSSNASDDRGVCLCERVSQKLEARRQGVGGQWIRDIRMGSGRDKRTREQQVCVRAVERMGPDGGKPVSLDGGMTKKRGQMSRALTPTPDQPDKPDKRESRSEEKNEEK